MKKIRLIIILTLIIGGIVSFFFIATPAWFEPLFGEEWKKHDEALNTMDFKFSGIVKAKVDLEYRNSVYYIDLKDCDRDEFNVKNKAPHYIKIKGDLAEILDDRFRFDIGDSIAYNPNNQMLYRYSNGELVEEFKPYSEFDRIYYDDFSRLSIIEELGK